MYQKDNSVLLRSNASALNKNVSILWSEISEDFQLHVGIIHKSLVSLVLPNAEHGLTGSKEIMCKDSGGGSSYIILQTKWCTLNRHTFLVVAHQNGVQIFDAEGSTLLCWHVFASPGSEKSEKFARGISACGDSLICVGSHNGEILMFNVLENGTSITHVGCVKRDNFSGPIADLCNQDHFLISADNNGIITVWRNEDTTLKQALNISNQYSNSSCSVISCWRNIIVSGFSNGMLRLFDLTQGNLIAEVMSHSRWISGMDIAPISGLLCTCSEDSYVRVWQLTSGKKPSISHKYSKCIQDMQLCGVAFCDAKGSSFCITAYDENELMMYSM